MRLRVSSNGVAEGELNVVSKIVVCVDPSCVPFPPVEIIKAHTMKALCWHGTNDIRCDSVPDPKIEDGRDVIIKVTSCAICGSDLHLMDGLMPTMKSGDILGHEFMGEVVETGSAHTKFRKGDRIVVRLVAPPNCSRRYVPKRASGVPTFTGWISSLRCKNIDSSVRSDLGLA